MTTYNLGGCEYVIQYIQIKYMNMKEEQQYIPVDLRLWSGKIALAYPSDYGYAADLNECKDKALYDYDSIPCDII